MKKIISFIIILVIGVVAISSVTYNAADENTFLGREEVSLTGKYIQVETIDPWVTGAKIEIDIPVIAVDKSYLVVDFEIVTSIGNPEAVLRLGANGNPFAGPDGVLIPGDPVSVNKQWGDWFFVPEGRTNLYISTEDYLSGTTDLTQFGIYFDTGVAGRQINLNIWGIYLSDTLLSLDNEDNLIGFDSFTTDSESVITNNLTTIGVNQKLLSLKGMPYIETDTVTPWITGAKIEIDIPVIAVDKSYLVVDFEIVTSIGNPEAVLKLGANGNPFAGPDGVLIPGDPVSVNKQWGDWFFVPEGRTKLYISVEDYLSVITDLTQFGVYFDTGVAGRQIKLNLFGLYLSDTLLSLDNEDNLIDFGNFTTDENDIITNNITALGVNQKLLYMTGTTWDFDGVSLADSVSDALYMHVKSIDEGGEKIPAPNDFGFVTFDVSSSAVTPSDFGGLAIQVYAPEGMVFFKVYVEDSSGNIYRINITGFGEAAASQFKFVTDEGAETGFGYYNSLNLPDKKFGTFFLPLQKLIPVNHFLGEDITTGSSLSELSKVHVGLDMVNGLGSSLVIGTIAYADVSVGTILELVETHSLTAAEMDVEDMVSGTVVKCYESQAHLDNFVFKRVDETLMPGYIDARVLDKVIADAELLSEEDYTVTSWADMQSKLSAAKTVSTDKDSYTQSQVDSAKNALEQAISNLVERSVDLSGLNAAILQAEGFTEEDYTAGSWANLLNKLEAAKAVVSNPSSNQAKIDQAENDLYEAIDNLMEPLLEANGSFVGSKEVVVSEMPYIHADTLSPWITGAKIEIDIPSADISKNYLVVDIEITESVGNDYSVLKFGVNGTEFTGPDDVIIPGVPMSVDKKWGNWFFIPVIRTKLFIRVSEYLDSITEITKFGIYYDTGIPGREVKLNLWGLYLSDSSSSLDNEDNLIDFENFTTDENDIITNNLTAVGINQKLSKKAVTKKDFDGVDLTDSFLDALYIHVKSTGEGGKAIPAPDDFGYVTIDVSGKSITPSQTSGLAIQVYAPEGETFFRIYIEDDKENIYQPVISGGDISAASMFKFSYNGVASQSLGFYGCLYLADKGIGTVYLPFDNLVAVDYFNGANISTGTGIGKITKIHIGLDMMYGLGRSIVVGSVAYADATNNELFELIKLSSLTDAEMDVEDMVSGTVVICNFGQEHLDNFSFRRVDAKMLPGFVTPIDLTALNEAIARAEALNKDDYTQSSWINLLNKLSVAKNIRDYSDLYTQTSVDNALAQLEIAISGLVKQTGGSDNDNNLLLWIGLGIGGGLLVAGGVVTFILIRRKRKNA